MALEIPTAEAVEYGRRVLATEIERIDRAIEATRQAGDHGAVQRWRRTRFTIKRLLGPDEGDESSCVIAPFDLRWLDREFRLSMLRVQAQVNIEPPAPSGLAPGSRPHRDRDRTGAEARLPGAGS